MKIWYGDCQTQLRDIIKLMDITIATMKPRKEIVFKVLPIWPIKDRLEYLFLEWKASARRSNHIQHDLWKVSAVLLRVMIQFANSQFRHGNDKKRDLILNSDRNVSTRIYQLQQLDAEFRIELSKIDIDCGPNFQMTLLTTSDEKTVEYFLNEINLFYQLLAKDINATSSKIFDKMDRIWMNLSRRNKIILSKKIVYL